MRRHDAYSTCSTYPTRAIVDQPSAPERQLPRSITTSVNAGRRAKLLVVSELFPPAVGGSAVLLHGIYSRMSGYDIAVLTHGSEPEARPTVLDGMAVYRRPMTSGQWGIVGLRPLRERVRLAMQMRRILRTRHGTVHCARALPEGLSALLAYVFGGAPYVCWAHGEELATARSSRELTMLTRWVYRLSRTAIANSRNTAAMLEGYGIPPSKIRVVHPAVDAERFR